MFNYIDKNKGFLFSTNDLQTSLTSTNDTLIKEIEKIDSNRLLNTSPEDLANFYVEKFHLTPITLLKDQWHAEQQETQVDVRFDPRRHVMDQRRPALVPGIRITVRVPFEGEIDLFYTRSNQFSMNPPKAKIEGSELVLSFEMPNDSIREIRQDVDSVIANIQEHIDWQKELIKFYNAHLYQVASQAIAQRRQRLLENSNQLASLGIPVKVRTDALKTYAVPELKKKVSTPLPLATSNAFKPEPALTMELYEHALTVIQNMTMVMERSPSSFKLMGEEDLRQHFLVQLNGQFEGKATGETFNSEGKTDILLRENGSNVFIAECKFWKGQKHFTEGIDQLLGYTAWRDNKTAILIFNRGTNMSTVLASVKETAIKHRNFKREISWPNESGFRFMFHNKNDVNREFYLTILVFDVPE